jgi:hypothetical protein
MSVGLTELTGSGGGGFAAAGSGTVSVGLTELTGSGGGGFAAAGSGT